MNVVLWDLVILVGFLVFVVDFVLLVVIIVGGLNVEDFGFV